MWITSLTSKIWQPNAIALGNFDGIHRGHLEVLEPVLKANEVIGCTKGHHNPSSKHLPLQKTVVSFTPHPREFFSGEKRKLLTPLAEKSNYLAKLGINQLILLPFDQQLSLLTPEEFVKSLLIDKIGVELISVGENFRFGYQRQGDAEKLKTIANSYGVKVNITRIKNHSNFRISSSQIRQALEDGDLETANAMLGREYSLSGKVVYGQQLGQKLGFPTANLEIPPEKFIPKKGVYLVEVIQEAIPNQVNYGLMNIGNRPTVDGRKLTVEIHILNWTGNLYNQRLLVKLTEFLRSEVKFESLTALKNQIGQDIQTAKQIIEQINTHA